MSKKNELSNLVAATHEELIAELPKLERLTQGERLKHNRKRRDKQLKKFKDLEEKDFRKSYTSSGRNSTRKDKHDSTHENPEQLVKNTNFLFQAKLFDSCKRNAKEVRSLVDELPEADQKKMIGSVNHFGMTALHKCVALSKPSIAKELINRGANLNLGDSDCWTPLHAASFIGDIEMVQIFVENGADVLMMNLDQQTCLDLCESPEVTEYLKAKFAALNMTEEAIYKLKAEPSLRMLEDMKKAHEIEGKEFSERRYENNATLLHIAAANGYIDCLDFILSLGADTDAVDNDGWTPLHTAVHWEQEDIIVKLVTANANVNIGTAHGEYVLDLAPTRELRERIENLLNKHNQNTQAALFTPNSLRSRELRTSSMARTLSLNKESASLPKDILDKTNVLTSELGLLELDAEEVDFLTFFHLNVDISDPYMKQVYGDSYEPKKIMSSDNQLRSLYSLQKSSQHTIFNETSEICSQAVVKRFSLPENFLFTKTSSGTNSSGGVHPLSVTSNSEVNSKNETQKEHYKDETNDNDNNEATKQEEVSEKKSTELTDSLPNSETSTNERKSSDDQSRHSRNNTAAGRIKSGTGISGTRREKRGPQETVANRLERVSCVIS